MSVRLASVLAATALAAALAAPAAQAGHVNWSVSLAVPGIGVSVGGPAYGYARGPAYGYGYVAPAPYPSYVAGPPVYGPPVAYYAPVPPRVAYRAIPAYYAPPVARPYYRPVPVGGHYRPGYAYRY